MALVVVLIFSALMVLVMLSGLRSSWMQERVQVNAGFHQLTFQAAESGLAWWLSSTQQRLREEGLHALQQEAWLAQPIQACVVATDILNGSCDASSETDFHVGVIPVKVELVTQFVDTQLAPQVSTSDLMYYRFRTQVEAYIGQESERRFVARHVQEWRWLDTAVSIAMQGD